VSKDNVAVLQCVTTLDIPVERVVEAILSEGLTKIIVMGYREDGSTFFGSSFSDGGDVMWLMEKYKKALLDV